MKLLKLTLENFQGIRQLELDLNGAGCSIFGANATGKTSVFNTLTWLLYDRPSTDEKNYTPKTDGPDGKPLHYLNHTAIGRFALESGRIVTLSKTYREVWKKKRGSPEEEFSGHETDHSIDGVPVKANEYAATLDELCGGVERMRVLTAHDYFTRIMPWEERRRILLEVCGDVSDDEVISSNTELGQIYTFLAMPGTSGQRHNVDGYKKIAASQKAEINKQLQTLPGRIDEAIRAIPLDMEDYDGDKAAAQLAELRKEYEALSERRAAVVSGDTAAAEIRAAIADATAELAQARAAHIASQGSGNEAIYAEIVAARKAAGEEKDNADRIRREISSKRDNVERMEKLRQSYLNDYAAIQAEAWDVNQETCPTCNQELPYSKVEAMRGEFNLKKSRRLEEINEAGRTKASKHMIETEQAVISVLENHLTASENIITGLEQHLETLQAQIKTAEPYETTAEHAMLTANISKLRQSEADAALHATEAAKSIYDEMQGVQERIRALESRMSSYELAETQKKRIEELKVSEKELAAKYEELERGVWLCELFMRTKVRLLDERINGKFKTVRFRLFKKQVNGGLKEDCEVMIPNESGTSLTPYAFANNAARINAGLEIVDTLSKHWGLSMPVFVDNAESVCELLDIDAQVIRLVVSKPDKELRLVLDEPKEEPKPRSKTVEHAA